MAMTMEIIELATNAAMEFMSLRGSFGAGAWVRNGKAKVIRRGRERSGSRLFTTSFPYD